MSNTQAPNGDEVLKALQAATHGLLFPSESDRPIKPFLWNIPSPASAWTTNPIDSAQLTTYASLPAGATVQPLALSDLFAPVITDETWFGPDEKAAAQRFRGLEALLGTLAGVAAFRVTPPDPRAPIQVYVVGHTGDGHLAGVTTELIET